MTTTVWTEVSNAALFPRITDAGETRITEDGSTRIAISNSQFWTPQAMPSVAWGATGAEFFVVTEGGDSLITEGGLFLVTENSQTTTIWTVLVPPPLSGAASG